AIFTRHYQALLGDLPPALRAARAALAGFVAAHPAAFPDHAAITAALLAHVESQKAERQRRADAVTGAPDATSRAAALAAYLEVFGDEALAWDVSSPTARERPDRFFPSLVPSPTGPPDAHSALATTAKPDAPPSTADFTNRLPAHERPVFSRLVAQARAAVALGENDDWLYARLQAPVRHAILALGARWLDRADDGFFLSLTTLLALDAGASLSPAALTSEIANNRAAWEHARRQPPPLAAGRAATTDPRADHWRGHGTGGRVVGPVILRHGPRGHTPPPDAVLVATSLLPTELPLLNVAALVIETGGPLGHVATLARERGLPAVVGAQGIVAALADGDIVVVDADVGLVVRAGAPTNDLTETTRP
ncbi:MAG TPA: PEP-utilizing enzyme, partial [Polyangia bacterium]